MALTKVQSEMISPNISMTVKTSSTSIPNGADTLVVWGTTEGTTTGITYSSGQATILTAGDYHVDAFVHMNSFTMVAGGTIRMGVFLNNSLIEYLDDYQTQSVSANFNWKASGSRLLKNLAVNDVVDIRFFQNSGSSQTVSNDATRGHFSLFKV